MKTWDISVALDDRLPVWPGSPGWETEVLQAIDADSEANVSRLALDLHTGTHVDAPLHFVEGGKTVEQIPLERTLGPAWVADLTRVDKVIRTEDLASAGIPERAGRLLLKTRNSELWTSSRFEPDYVALDGGAARWLVGAGIELVGIDYLSIQKFEDGPEVHEILLEEETVILEGLDLSDVEAERFYRLCCLPLKIAGVEASPVRAILREA